jgi:O-antigen/teichoic acid export membrane protein
MVGYFLSAMEVGIYLIATEIALSTKKVRQWFDPIFSPIVSELAYRQDTQRIGHNFATVTRWILTINIAFLCGVFLIGEELLGLFGPEFGIGFLTMIILAVSHVVYSSMGSGDTILIMSGHPYINLVNTVIVVAVNFGLNVVLIPKFGMVGAAVGTLVSFSLLTLIRGIEVYRLFRIHPFRWVLLKPILSATVSFAIAYTTSLRLLDYDVLRMVVPPLLFMGCYGLSLWRMKLEDEDYLVLERLFARLRRKNAKKNAWRLSV